MGAIYEAGMRVPHDISLIGYDNILLSAYTRPGLTTLGISRTEVASIAFRTLWDQSRDESAMEPVGRDHVVQPFFVERSSTGPATK